MQITLADVISSYCHQYRVTQTEIARRAGLTKQYMSKVMNGYTLSGDDKRRQIDPTLSLLRSLSDAMRIRTVDLVAILDGELALSAKTWRQLESDRLDRVARSVVNDAMRLDEFVKQNSDAVEPIGVIPTKRDQSPQMTDEEAALVAAVARVLSEKQDQK